MNERNECFVLSLFTFSEFVFFTTGHSKIFFTRDSAIMISCRRKPKTSGEGEERGGKVYSDFTEIHR